MKEIETFLPAGCGDSTELNFDFTFAYQPIVDIRDWSIFGHEALIRGVNGEGALSILSKVDDSNRYIFDQVCRMRAISTAANLNMAENLSINLLPNAIHHPGLCICSTLQAARIHNFPIEKLIFEMVEAEYLLNKPRFTEVLREYREYGFKTAIDDFGAGYSGLSLLADFQPDFIKLDISLVRDIHRDGVRQAIIRGVLMMCKDLGVIAIAEGIECPEERDFLADCGIYLMQGYWFAKPVFNGLAQVELLSCQRI